MPESARTLTAALIGCGRMGAWTSDRVRRTAPTGWLPLSHAEAMQTVDGIKLTAVCDINGDVAERTAKHYDVERIFTDPHKLIDEVCPDILAIATRTPGRCDLIEHAAVAGVKAIHAEKPVGRNLGEIKRAMKAVQDHSAAFTFGATRRFMPAFIRAQEAAASGQVGELEQVSVDLGRTLLMWNHPHSTDLLFYYSGSSEVTGISAVVADDLPEGPEIETDPILDSATVRFANGVTGLITSARGMNVHIDGRDGRLSVEGDGSRVVHRKRRQSDSPYFLDDAELGFDTRTSGTVAAFRALREAVITGEPVREIQPDDVIRSHQLLFGLALSAQRGGCKVSMDDVKDDFTVTGQFNGMFA